MSKIEVKPFTESKSEEWDSFVRDASNGTLFHLQEFLDYHPSERFDERHLMFYYKGQNLVGVLPLAVMEEDGKTVARSPYGGSYGGVVVDEDIKFRYSRDIVRSLLDHLEGEVDTIRLRPTPREFSTSPSCYMEYNYLENDFEVYDKEVTNVVDLTRFEDDPFEVYESRCRRAVRGARESDLEIEEWSEDWGSFHEILTKTLDKYDKEPTHTESELRWISEEFPDELKLTMARLDAEPVAGVMSIQLNPKVNFIFYNCHLEEYQELSPINYLQDNEIRWSKKNGFEYVDLGTSVENFESIDSLIKFKESFGATGFFRNVYTYDF